MNQHSRSGSMLPRRRSHPYATQASNAAQPGVDLARAISRLYEEPKKLVVAGLATSRPGGDRAAAQHRVHHHRRRPPGASQLAGRTGRRAGAGVRGPGEDCLRRSGDPRWPAGQPDGAHRGCHRQAAFRRHDRPTVPGGPGTVPRLPAVERAYAAVPVEYHVTMLRWARDQVLAWPEDLSQLEATAAFSRIVSAASSPGTDW